MFERANETLKSAEDKEERLMLLESWKQFEVRSRKNLSFFILFFLSNKYNDTYTNAWKYKMHFIHM